MPAKDTWNPAQYSKFQRERAAPFFDLMALVQPAEIGFAVDLGCGSGELTKTLHENFQVGRTVGLDSSDAMLQKAKAFESDSLNFQKGDISSFHEKLKYQLVFSNAAMQWCPNHELILKNIFESLIDGGQIAIQVPANHDYITHVVARELASEKPYSLHIEDSDHGNAVLKIETYATLLHKIGYAEKTVFMKVYSHLLESREEVVEWVRGTMLTYYQSRLSADLYDQFFEEFKHRLFDVLPDEKPFFYPFKRIFLHAFKSI